MAVRLAGVDELTAWMGLVDPAQAALVLDSVSGTAIRLCQPVSADWTSADLVPGEIKGLVLQVAARVAANPTGLTSEALSGYSSGRPDRGIVLTADERQALLEAAGLIYESASSTLSVPLRPRW